MRADLFIVGMPRCGTTQLYQYFQAHPEVFAPWYKELEHFGQDLHFYSMLSRRGYEALFAPGAAFTWRVDASTSSLMSRTAAEEIAAYAPNARIIIGLREPRAWLASQYGVLALWRHEGRSFEKALGEAPTAEGVPGADCLESHDYWSNLMALPEQVGRYLEVFGRERVFIYRLEELAEPHRFFERLCSWLGIAYMPAQPGWRNAREELRYWPVLPRVLAGRVRRRMVNGLLDHAPWMAMPAYRAWNVCRGLVLRALNPGARAVCPLQPGELSLKQREQLNHMLAELEVVTGMDLSGWKISA